MMQAVEVVFMTKPTPDLDLESLQPSLLGTERAGGGVRADGATLFVFPG